MPTVLDPFRFVLTAVAGWMNQHQLQVIDYLREENRVLCEQLRGRRIRFNDDQRRRLAAKAKDLGRKLLVEMATIVTPETSYGLKSGFWFSPPIVAMKETWQYSIVISPDPSGGLLVALGMTRACL